jgi:hypothetical protein
VACPARGNESSSGTAESGGGLATWLMARGSIGGWALDQWGRQRCRQIHGDCVRINGVTSRSTTYGLDRDPTSIGGPSSGLGAGLLFFTFLNYFWQRAFGRL